MDLTKQTLRFAPDAWAKIQHMTKNAKTEISGFGIVHPDDPLYVMEFQTIKQECTSAYTEMDDNAVADFFDQQVERGLQPASFARVWIHTHPGMSPNPSSKDEDTFKKQFGSCNHAFMCIFGKNGGSYCRLSVDTPLGRAEFEIDTAVDFTSYEFLGSNTKEWIEELTKNVNEKTYVTTHSYHPWFNGAGFGDPDEQHYGRWVENYQSSREKKAEKKQAQSITKIEKKEPADASKKSGGSKNTIAELAESDHLTESQQAELVNNYLSGQLQEDGLFEEQGAMDLGTLFAPGEVEIEPLTPASPLTADEIFDDDEVMHKIAALPIPELEMFIYMIEDSYLPEEEGEIK